MNISWPFSRNLPPLVAPI